ncbi:hypothetical protein AU476_12785 [Cupriavidus sp. UYMSc13B]|nr:hypothetical protein AU476_12785 [Cupriavidus sp. UYMSc13B]
MSLPKYPQYKDSEVAWLGEIPARWDTQRAKFLFVIKKRISGEEGYDVLSITQNGIRVKDIESNDGQLSMDYAKYQFVEIGDFAMNHMDLLTGYVDISQHFGVTSPDYRVFSIRDKLPSTTDISFICFKMAIGGRFFMLSDKAHPSSDVGVFQLSSSTILFFRYHHFANKLASRPSSTAKPARLTR